MRGEGKRRNEGEKGKGREGEGKREDGREGGGERERGEGEREGERGRERLIGKRSQSSFTFAKHPYFK